MLSCFAKNTGFAGNLEEGQEPHPPKRWEKTTGNLAGKSSSHSRDSGCGFESEKAAFVKAGLRFSAAAVFQLVLRN